MGDAWVALREQFEQIVLKIKAKILEIEQETEEGVRSSFFDFWESGGTDKDTFEEREHLISEAVEEKVSYARDDFATCLEEFYEVLISRDVQSLSRAYNELYALCSRHGIDVNEERMEIDACFQILNISETSVLYLPTQSSIVIPRVILGVNDELIKIVAQKPELLFEIPPRTFEEIIADIFFKKGYQVELTIATRDGGRDIIAIFEHLKVRTKYLIECKRYARNRKVSIGLVQRLLGVKIAESANKAILATTSSFTRPARQFATNNIWDLDLKDYDDVVAWVKSYH